MHIDHLAIKNYGGFSDFSFDFPKQNLCVFIGENGSGKTTILESLFILLSADRLGLSDYAIKMKNVNNPILSISLTNRNTTPLNFAIKLKSKADNIIFYEKGGHLLFDEGEKEMSWDNMESRMIEFSSFTKNKNIFTAISFFEAIEKDFLRSVYSRKTQFYTISTFIQFYKDLVFYDTYLTKKYKSDYSPKEAVDKAIFTFAGIQIDTEIGESITDLQVYFLKGNEKLSFEQLSAGEQKTINLIGQIIDAFVPAMKENTDDILDFPGVVLIDEIETHLHPRWQREILPNLMKTFPKLQFIVTTHSPQVISTAPKECVFLLKGFEAFPVKAFTEGKDSNSLLKEVFGITERPQGAMSLLAKFYTAINEKNILAAENILQNMRESWGDLDAEVIHATWDFEELLNEKEGVI